MVMNWDYAKLSEWASKNGGPQKALETVKDYYTNVGFKKGAASKNPLIVGVGISCLALGCIGIRVYDKIKEKKALKLKVEIDEQVKVKEAEAEFVDAMEQDKPLEGGN